MNVGRYLRGEDRHVGTARVKPRDQYTDAWGKHQPSAQAREILWAASYAEHPPAPSTGRHHHLRALALFEQMLASDFGGPLHVLVNAEQNIAAQQERIALYAAARMKRITLERDIERYLVKRAKAQGGEVRKVQWIGRRSAPDRLVMLPARRAPVLASEVVAYRDANQVTMADALAVLKVAHGGDHPPTTIWVELKAPGVKPETHQLREHARMRALGQRVEVIDSFEAVDRLLG